jgi:ferredoxin
MLIPSTSADHAECATCHLYIPASTSPTVPPPPIAEASDDELDMLGYAVGYRDGASRLGCQIKVDRALGLWAERGGVIGLPRF